MPSIAEELKRDYGVHLDLHPGPIEAARRDAQHAAQYLVLYLHCPTHESTAAFVRDVLGSDAIAERLRGSTVYAASVMTAEGHRLARELGATTFPFVAVFLRRAGPPVMRLLGPLSASEFAHEWDVHEELWGAARAEEVAAAAERRQREDERMRGEAHLAAIEAADRARLDELERQAAERRAAAEAAQQEEQRRAQEAEAAQKEAAAAAALEEARARALAEQQRTRVQAAQARLPPEPPAGAAEAALVNLRVPGGGGAPIQRRFSYDDLVDALEDWAVVAGGYAGGEVALLCGFPLVPLEWERGVTRFRDVKALIPKSTVLVRFIESSPVMLLVSRSRALRSRFQPYAMAVQTRFKWRHKETDRWRRLMDATCFPVDWIGQTRGANLSQYSGHWTHLLTCAHVICPWDYPNYYPTEGPTRFVSRVTLSDTMTQVRLVSLQGKAVFKHFTSNQHVFTHANPRLDLCVIHPEQNLKRSGEMKMLWMQNEGMVVRPRLELNERLSEGDHVWIYGMSAHESLFDEEKGPEPLMIPTGVRARVRALTREHFFLDTSLEDGGGERSKIHMGMCGSVVMRNGRCVGMLTATVHEESKTRALAGTAMCTYSQDIFEFLLEVEKQMKNPRPKQWREESTFEARRRGESEAAGAAPPEEFRDWELDGTRLARHIPAPVSLWHMEESWMTEEDFLTNTVFGRSGVFNQETQESALGYDMSSSKTGGERPGDMAAFHSHGAGGKPFMQGQRKDDSPVGVYAPAEDFKRKDVWDYEMAAEMRSLFDRNTDDKDAQSLNAMRQSLETIRAQRAMEQMKETAMKHPGSSSSSSSFGGSSDPLHGRSGSGHFGGHADSGTDGFNPEHAYGGWEDEQQQEQQGFGSGGGGGGVPSSHPYRQQRPESAGPATAAETPTQRRKRERREAEAKYQAELRKRHGSKAIPFGDEDLAGMWRRED